MCMIICFICLFFAAILPVNISDMKFEIPELTGDNYKMWKERILLQLGCMDIDYAIRKDEPPAVVPTSTQVEIAAYERWERSNRLSMMFIRTKISASIRGSIPECRTVNELLKAIDAQFESSDKALASTLMAQLSSMKLTTVKGVRGHIMKMRDIAAQLKSLEVDMSESFLVHFILNSLPLQYSPFKISYNTHKEKWSINELLTMCVQEEGRLTLEMGESAHYVAQGKHKVAQAKNKGKGKLPVHKEMKKEPKCFFCKKKGHFKKDCLKFKAWLDKKGTLTSFVCYESNMVVCHNTWWIDSGSTIHVSNTLQGFLNQRKPLGSEQNIYSGNKISSHVEAIGTCRLVLHSGFVLDLEKTFYIPSFSRNLISVSRLVLSGYSFNFSETAVDLFYKSKLVGNGTMSDNLFQINL